MVPKDLPGEGLHVGDGRVAEAYGIHPVRDGGGYGQSRFLGKGEVAVVGPIGKAARAIHEGELEVPLPHEGLARHRDPPRVGLDLRGRPRMVAPGEAGEKEVRYVFVFMRLKVRTKVARRYGLWTRRKPTVE